MRGTCQRLPSLSRQGYRARQDREKTRTREPGPGRRASPLAQPLPAAGVRPRPARQLGPHRGEVIRVAWSGTRLSESRGRQRGIRVAWSSAGPDGRGGRSAWLERRLRELRIAPALGHGGHVTPTHASCPGYPPTGAGGRVCVLLLSRACACERPSIKACRLSRLSAVTPALL